MKLTLIAVSISALLMGCSNANLSTNQTSATMNTSTTSNQLQEMNLSYPKTQKGDVTDTYFGKQVADPYRWLEDDMSSETEQWVQAENAVTQAYLAQVPSRDKLKERLKVLLDYEKVGAPFKEGKYTYFFKNDGLQNQAVLYRQLDDGEAQVFLDPNSFSEDGTTSLASIDFSKDGSLVTYLISEGGSDWRKAITIDVETMQPVSETLKDIKFSGISWLGNEGFYYSSYDKPEGSELSAKTDQHKLYFHRLNDKQTQDTLVFGGTDEQKNRYVSGQVTEDNRYLLISAAVSTSGNKLYLKDLSKPDSPLVTILENTDSDTNLLDNEGSTLLFVTNLDAPNKRVVSVDASQPQPENWQDFIAQTDNVLDVSTGGGYIFASYMVDAISNVKQLDMSGKLVREITLPGVGTASGFDGKKDQQTLYYSFTNYKTPSTIFSLNVESGESSVYLKSKANFDSDAYESKQVFYTSKDGTKVPMIITHKKGLKLDGTNPTMLYGKSKMCLMTSSPQPSI